tara:strand:- start:228 stop:1433 length:1206 start_codon:yes stop_codon:yes gene_type:complete
MAKLFGIIPYGGGSPVGEFVKDVGDVGTGFMSAAVQSAQTQDKREADMADAVESSILKAKLNVDSKYPKFLEYEDTKLQQYKSLAENPAVGPDKAPFFYYAPGFLDKKTWMEDAIAWSQNPRNKDYKWTGGTMPEETYAENINKYRTDVKGSFSGHHGDYMEKLFVSQGEDVTTPPSDIGQKAVTGVGTTDTAEAVATATGGGMFPPAKKLKKSEQIDNIWSTVIAASQAGMSPEDLVGMGILTQPQLAIWYNTSGVGDLRLEAMKTVAKFNTDLYEALLGDDKAAAKLASGKIAAMTNLYYESIYAPVLAQKGEAVQNNLVPVTIDNKTYQPTDTNTPDTNDRIYGLKTDDGTDYYIYRNGVFVKVIYDEANKKTLIEGTREYKKFQFEEEYKDKPFIPG